VALGVSLGDRRRRHGDHDCRIAVGEGLVEYCCLYPPAVRLQSRTEKYFGHQDVGTGPVGVIGNIVWLLLAGWWLSLGHPVTAIVLAVTIVGTRFAWAHLKLAGLAPWPIGKAIVPVQNARLANS
jgi:uncharacterized membrane protein YccF (DUF307 family)